MASVLETLGFEVTHLENAEYRAMERAIRKFGKQLRNGGAGLFYFAGNRYKELKNKLYAKKWVVDVRDPVKNPENVLEYLAR